ncbi:MAG: hypothetical protein N2Z73_00980 [Endomicrobia bacterium]|nr:hypothetical protein [Endomicrobiia bacterium]
MKKKIFIIFVSFLFCQVLFSEVSKEFQYTGFLREFGQPVTGQRNMIFNIYTQPSGGMLIWSSGEVSVLVSSGVFSYTLSPNIDLRDGNFWIETIIGGKVFSPRQKITPQVFALHSNTAEGLTKKGDIHFVIHNTTYAFLTPSGFIINGDLTLTGKIKATNAVDVNAIVDEAITTEKIKNKTIIDADISDDAQISLAKTSGNLPLNRLQHGFLPQEVVAQSVSTNSVYTAAIQDSAVTTAKIADQTIIDADISPTASISWSKISKIGSSLADLAFRSANDIHAGNLNIGRMPLGGNWYINSNLSILGDTFTIIPQGRIGVGTSNPESDLHIFGRDRSINVIIQSSWTTLPPYHRSSLILKTYNQTAEFTVTNDPGHVGGLLSSSGKLVLRAPIVEIQNTSSQLNYISVRDSGVGINTTAPSYTLHVNGSFAATSKNFEIPHPTKPNKKLIHACVEGPENAVYYRGRGKLLNYKAEIYLPEYFEALTRKENRTVQLTAIGEEPFVLSCSDVKDGKFSVYGTKIDGEFFWEVKAVRADIEELQVEK